jgi:IS5 family transposase
VLCSHFAVLCAGDNIEEGNPADAERLVPVPKRHVSRYGCAPRQLAVDGGYATKDNLEQAQGCGVEDVAFRRKRGLRIEEMVESTWVYRQLRNFRAGLEAGTSCLKRAYGLSRCTGKGLAHFKAFVWSSAMAHNLALLARLKPARGCATLSRRFPWARPLRVSSGRGRPISGWCSRKSAPFTRQAR